MRTLWWRPHRNEWMCGFEPLRSSRTTGLEIGDVAMSQMMGGQMMWGMGAVGLLVIVLLVLVIAALIKYLFFR